jgi:hypothetical protein
MGEQEGVTTVVAETDAEMEANANAAAAKAMAEAEAEAVEVEKARAFFIAVSAYQHVSLASLAVPMCLYFQTSRAGGFRWRTRGVERCTISRWTCWRRT